MVLQKDSGARFALVFGAARRRADAKAPAGRRSRCDRWGHPSYGPANRESAQIPHLAVRHGSRGRSRDLADSAALHRQLSYWGVRIVTLADGDVNKMLVAVKGLLGSMFLDDLAQKTKRGQVGRVKAGRIPGGRCYGYDVVRDGQEGGKRTINEAEAGVVRRIYAEYVEGRSPLKIVQALNAQGVPGPRGGHWNVSALIGSAKRRNGLLNNSLYAGRITYNRQRFIKDPATGRRQARANPQDRWLTQDVPELAIVSATCLTVRRPCGPRASGHTPSTTVGRSTYSQASSSAAVAAQA